MLIGHPASSREGSGKICARLCSWRPLLFSVRTLCVFYLRIVAMEAPGQDPPPPPPANTKKKPPPPSQRKKDRKSEPKSRKNLTYSDKRKIIKMIDEGCTKAEAGRRFGINESTIRGIYASKEKIKEHFATLPNSKEAEKATRSWNVVTNKTENLLKRYLDRQARRNISVDTKEIQDVARQIYDGVAAKWNITNPQPFNASRGWFDRFKRRYEVKNITISGEAASADKEQADAYPEHLKSIIEEGQYTPEQIFNMDETNFYWKTAPRKSFVVTKAKSIRGRKPMRQRYTLLLACNAAGYKLKPTVVHTAKKPRSYRDKDMKKLNVHWLRSKKGYVSSHLSIEWLIDCFMPEVKEYCRINNIRFNILLLLDNAPGHSPMMREMDPDVRVEFLPPNTTSLIQPLDQEVISVLKASYATRQFKRMREVVQDERLIQELIDSDQEDSVPDEVEEEGDQAFQNKVVRYYSGYSIKSSVDLMVACWNDINIATISHGWANILKAVREAEGATAVAGDLQTTEAAVAEAAAAASAIFGGVSTQDIEAMLEPPPLTASDILEEEQALADDDLEEQQHPTEPTSPSPSMALKEVKELLLQLMKTKHLLEQDTDNDIHCANIASAISKYEDKYKSQINSMQQRKITSFFTPPSTSAPSDPDDPAPGPSGLQQPTFTSSSDSEPEFEGFLDTIVQRGRGGGGDNQ